MSNGQRTIERIAPVGRCTEKEAKALAKIGFPQEDVTVSVMWWINHTDSKPEYCPNGYQYYGGLSGSLEETSGVTGYAAPNFDELYSWLLERHRYGRLQFLCGELHLGCTIEADSPRYNRQYQIYGRTPFHALFTLAIKHPEG